MGIRNWINFLREAPEFDIVWVVSRALAALVSICQVLAIGVAVYGIYGWGQKYWGAWAWTVEPSWVRGMFSEGRLVGLELLKATCFAVVLSIIKMMVGSLRVPDAWLGSWSLNHAICVEVKEAWLEFFLWHKKLTWGGWSRGVIVGNRLYNGKVWAHANAGTLKLWKAVKGGL
jgi:hypothetical protein